MKTVTRTATVLVVAALAMFAWVGVASAQGTDYTQSEPQLSYDGPFASNADALAPVTGALGFDLPDIQASSDPAAAGDGTVGGTGGGLAVTGSEVDLPVVAAISLMGAGGVILVAARRRAG